MRVFITGSGTLAKELTRQLHSVAEKVVVFSRSESKQAEMRNMFPEGPPSAMRYRLGDIRDMHRLQEAMSDCDICIHTAALKRIDTCETETRECMKTNIIGTNNVALACRNKGIQKALFISTDKAPNPCGAYGASKLFGEQLWIGTNNLTNNCEYSCVRYGNVRGSTGAVHGIWKRQAEAGEALTVTDPDMSRFFWSISEAGRFIIQTLGFQYWVPGVIFLPKMAHFKISDIARKYSDDIKYTGLRCSEKMHEELLTEVEVERCYEQGDRYAVYPSHEWNGELSPTGLKVPAGFRYTSEKGACVDAPFADINTILSGRRAQGLLVPVSAASAAGSVHQHLS